MKVLFIFLCNLVAVLSCCGQGPDRSHGFQPSSGLVVAIDPEKLVGLGLEQSWLNVRTPLGRNMVASQPLSKINFRIQPIESIDGAVVRLSLTGTSVGESSSTNRSGEILMDSLTRCEASQLVFMGSPGLAFDNCICKVHSHQSLKKVKSKNPFAGAFTKMAFRHFPEEVRSRADLVAQQQMQNHIAISNAELKNSVESMAAQMISTYPLISEFDWHFSSDSRRVYIAAATDAPPVGSATISPSAISVTVHESIVEAILNRRLSNRQLTSESLEGAYTSLPDQLNLPEFTDRAGAAWSVQFGPKPVEVEFLDDGIVVRLTSNRIQSGNRTLSGMTVVARYVLKRSGAKWILARQEEVDVIHSEVGAEKRGARQQVFKTVMRKRFDRIVPSSVTIPEWAQSKRLDQLGMDLKFREMILDNQNLVIAIDSR